MDSVVAATCREEKAMQHKRYRCTWLAAVAATAVVVSACSNTATETPAASNTPQAAASVPGAANNAATHNDADVMFAQGMIPHHQQAIEMSDMVLSKQGIAPEIITLANQIKDAQGPEIEQMQGWLADWGTASTPSPSTSMPGHDMGDMPGHNMPGMGDMPGMGGGGHGMMSEADMADLQNAQGAAAGRLFLTQMIEHHEGAITMAQNEIANGAFPAAVDMARNIVSSQQQEIATMQEILKQN